MCNPKPLSRCASHAGAESSKSYHIYVKAIGARGSAKNRLLMAEESLQEVEACYSHAPDDPNAENDILKATKKVEIAKNNLEKANTAAISAIENYQESLLIKNATLSGRKHLKKYPDLPNGPEQLAIAEEMHEWDKRVRNMKDSSGVKIVSKEGKFSPEAPAKFKELITEAEAGEAAAEANERKSILKERELKNKLAQKDNELSALSNLITTDWPTWEAENQKSKDILAEIQKTKNETFKFRQERRMHTIHKKDLNEALAKAGSI